MTTRCDAPSERRASTLRLVDIDALRAADCGFHAAYAVASRSIGSPSSSQARSTSSATNTVIGAPGLGMTHPRGSMPAAAHSCS